MARDRDERVSAVIPVHNGSDLVGEAIESVYAQTVLPEEVIVVDDGSTDDTWRILGQFAGRPGFRRVRKRQGGSATARNVGVQHATADYVAFLDHDDLWRPEKLEVQVSRVEPDWGMSFTAYERAGPEGIELVRHEEWQPSPETVTARLGYECCVGPPSTAMLRREILQAVGPFEQVTPFGDDWLMWLRIASAGYPIGYVPEPLTVYRWHGANLSDDERGFFDCACEVFDRYGDQRLRVWWRLHAAIYAHQHRDRGLARRRIMEAARIRPRSVRPGWVKLLR